MPKRPPLPSADISRHGRVWKDVKAEDLEPGDVVPGKGLVEGVSLAPDYVTVEWMSRERDHFRADQRVRAFVKAQPLTPDSK
jgi:hypothetical protein